MTKEAAAVPTVVSPSHQMKGTPAEHAMAGDLIWEPRLCRGN